MSGILCSVFPFYGSSDLLYASLAMETCHLTFRFHFFKLKSYETMRLLHAGTMFAHAAFLVIGTLVKPSGHSKPCTFLLEAKRTA